MNMIAAGSDPCTENVWWSAINAAVGDATLSGVLAGLLIAAAAALLARYDRSDSHTIALFGSGVPALAFATYLFTVIAGMNFPDTTEANKHQIGQVCSQVWSEWLLAMGLLFIGGAVLVCGLGWALVSYADNLATKSDEGRESAEATQVRRIAFIRLNGWLSGGVISTTIALLIPANVLYLKNVHHRGFFASAEVKGYAILTVFLLGIFFISWSTYVAAHRTRSAVLASARAHADRSARPPDNLYMQSISRHIERFIAASRADEKKKKTMRALCEIAVALFVPLGAALAVYMTVAAGQKGHWAAIAWVAGLYLAGRLACAAYARIARRAHRCFRQPKSDAAVGAGRATPGRIRYCVGKLSVATRGVVALAIFGAFFDVALTQGHFSTTQSVLTLLLGGLFPAIILTGLSHSIPAGEGAGSALGPDVPAESQAAPLANGPATNREMERL